MIYLGFCGMFSGRLGRWKHVDLALAGSPVGLWNHLRSLHP